MITADSMAIKICHALEKKGIEHYLIRNEDNDGPLILASWEEITYDKYNSIRNVMEKHDIEHAYPDEFQDCSMCGCGLRVKSDYPGWQPEFVADDEMTFLCKDCFIEELEKYGNQSSMLSMYTAHPQHYMLPKWTRQHLIKLGWKAHDTYELGIQFPLTSKYPENVAKYLEENGIFNYIFVAGEVGPFVTKYTVYTL